MKKKIIITVLFIVSIIALIFIGCLIDFFKPVRHGIPIDEITGIYSSAKLKQGRIITHGTYFPDDPDSFLSHELEKEILILPPPSSNGIASAFTSSQQLNLIN